MTRFGFLTALLVAFLLSGAAMAQEAGRGDRGERARGNFDPAQFRQRMMDRYKEQLGASDEEWKVLQPRLEKVMTVQREARSGGFGGFGGRGRGDRNDQAQTPVAKAMSDLRQAVENNASAAELAKRITALRDARAKARQNLEAAQKDLREVLTAKQEATLIMSGMLD